jgi:hypothetical protein
MNIPADIVATVAKDNCLAETASIHPLRTIALYFKGKAEAANSIMPSLETQSALNQISFQIEYSTRHNLYR